MNKEYVAPAWFRLREAATAKEWKVTDAAWPGSHTRYIPECRQGHRFDYVGSEIAAGRINACPIFRNLTAAKNCTISRGYAAGYASLPTTSARLPTFTLYIAARGMSGERRGRVMPSKPSCAVEPIHYVPLRKEGRGLFLVCNNCVRSELFYNKQESDDSAELEESSYG